MQMQEYGLNIVHEKGSDYFSADTLSRILLTWWKKY
jgi:hypothetical protein